ncbi:hypothetical protein HPB48_021814 [Haemaphysalis longicornis]|uniref:SDR family oxidoreductase n=1 Tax=Haemaphysalis longicornis TaxID=44386 RepID=A0A9J6GH32_HAELO|nr:hypothetical protein HPB48_021814 [Haemaphysalis longicornis]
METAPGNGRSVNDDSPADDPFRQGTFLMSRAATRGMIAAGISDGAIVNISSRAAREPVQGLSSYLASKGGIESLTRAMALDLGQHGIRCNAVVPGLTDTPVVENLPEHIRRSCCASIPLGRLARPDEIAQVVAFLCCPESSYVSGASWVVDGGKP